MNIRDLKNDDLKVTKGDGDIRGNIRVHVSLKGATFVNHTYWLAENDLGKPETLARIKADLTRKLQVKVDALAKYLRPSAESVESVV